MKTSTTTALWLVVGSIFSVQVGSAVAKTLFDAVTPLDVVWLRLVSAALALFVARRFMAVKKSTPRSPREPRIWRHLLAYAACLVGMNLSIYTAFSRLPLGIGVTIEFLGPLAVAVLGARRARDLLWPALALAGVALLGFRPQPLDPIGVALAAVAAACWAGYILTATHVGRSWQAMDALMTSCTIGAVALAVPALAHSGHTLLHPHVLLAGAVVGLMSTAIPYSLEMAALTQLPQRVFGTLMSLEPAAAALAALVLLHEGLTTTDLVAMACVVAASLGATRSA